MIPGKQPDMEAEYRLTNLQDSANASLSTWISVVVVVFPSHLSLCVQATLGQILPAGFWLLLGYVAGLQD